MTKQKQSDYAKNVISIPISNMTPIDNLPPAYQYTLRELSNQTGKPQTQLLIMALDGLFEKFRYSLLKTEGSNPPQSSQTTYLSAIDYCPSQLEIIPKNGQYRILLRLDQGISISQQAYKNLAEALNAINASKANRDKWVWSTVVGNYPVVIAQKKPSHTPHLWLAQNTACKMFNNQSNNPCHYSLTTKLPMQKLCKVCINNYNLIKNSHLNIEVANGIIVGPVYDNPLF